MRIPGHCIPGKASLCRSSLATTAAVSVRWAPTSSTEWLFDLLIEDQNAEGSSHDFGKDIIPAVVQTQRVFAYPFRDRNVGADGSPYWRDVGTIDAYYQANMDLVDVVPVLNLYDQSWPIRTLQPQLPPPKFVHFAPGGIGEARRGEAVDSMVCAGSIISGGHVRHSILSPNVRVHSYAMVEDQSCSKGQMWAQGGVGGDHRDNGGAEDTHVGYNADFDRRRGSRPAGRDHAKGRRQRSCGPSGRASSGPT